MTEKVCVSESRTCTTFVVNSPDPLSRGLPAKNTCVTEQTVYEPADRKKFHGPRAFWCFSASADESFQHIEKDLIPFTQHYDGIMTEVSENISKISSKSLAKQSGNKKNILRQKRNKTLENDGASGSPFLRNGPLRVKQTVSRESAKLVGRSIVPVRPSTHAPRIPSLRVCV